MSEAARTSVIAMVVETVAEDVCSLVQYVTTDEQKGTTGDSE